MRLLHIALSHGDNGLTRALKKVSTEYAEVPTNHPDLNGEICRVLDSFNPTCVWIQIQSEGLTTESLQKLHDHPVYVINWTGDVRAQIPDFYFQYAKYIDLTCFSNMNDVRTFRSLGYASEYLQIGFDPEIYCQEGEKKQVPDIVFMANNSSQFPLSKFRGKLVSFLQETYGSRFGVYGSGWNPSNGNYMGDQHGEAAVYRGAKIAISCSHFDYDRYFSDRLIRAMGCGVCVLTHKYLNLHKDFNDGSHLVSWENIVVLKHAIDWLLENDKNRLEVGKRGLEHVKKFFTFDAMAENLIRIYEERKR